MSGPWGRPPRDVVWPLAGAACLSVAFWLAVPAAASVQALVSTYLHRYEVVTSPPTAGPSG